MNYLQLYWQEKDKGLHFHRLGQWFCTKYIKKPWPELYYANYDEAVAMIDQWLSDNHYLGENLPTPINYQE